MLRTSKYLNKTFDNGWVCTHVGIARVQNKKTRQHTVSRQPGRQTYYYIFERETSDGKADKLIRLSAQQAAKVYRGELKVEDVAEARQAVSVNRFTSKVSYHFYHEKK